MEVVQRVTPVDGETSHTKNFIEVVRSRKMEDLRCPIQAGSNIATFCQMGNIAYRTGDKIHWDNKKGMFNEAEANKYLAKDYQNGYSIPKVK